MYPLSFRQTAGGLRSAIETVRITTSPSRHARCLARALVLAGINYHIDIWTKFPWKQCNFCVEISFCPPPTKKRSELNFSRIKCTNNTNITVLGFRVCVPRENDEFCRSLFATLVWSKLPQNSSHNNI